MATQLPSQRVVLVSFTIRNSKHGLKGGCIYALADPREPDQRRYIGQSFRPVGRRTQHVWSSRFLRQGATAKERWIADLLSRGLYPRVLVLEHDIPPSSLGARERVWIVRSLENGHALTNAVLYRGCS